MLRAIPAAIVSRGNNKTAAKQLEVLF